MAATIERWRRLFDSHGVRAFAMHAPYKKTCFAKRDRAQVAVHTTSRSFAGTLAGTWSSTRTLDLLLGYPLYEASSGHDINVVAELPQDLSRRGHGERAAVMASDDPEVVVPVPGANRNLHRHRTRRASGLDRRRRFAWPGRVCTRCTCTTTTG